jgi:hypothetical protein
VGLGKVRSGTERNPAIGYTISRALVGEWIFALTQNMYKFHKIKRRPESQVVIVTFSPTHLPSPLIISSKRTGESEEWNREESCYWIYDFTGFSW